MVIDAADIKLLEILRVELPPNSGRTPQFRVKFGVKHIVNDGNLIEWTFYIDRKDWKEDSLVALCRNYIHRLSSGIGSATSEWLMTEDQIDACRQTKSP